MRSLRMTKMVWRHWRFTVNDWPSSSVHAQWNYRCKQPSNSLFKEPKQTISFWFRSYFSYVQIQRFYVVHFVLVCFRSSSLWNVLRSKRIRQIPDRKLAGVLGGREWRLHFHAQRRCHAPAKPNHSGACNRRSYNVVCLHKTRWRHSESLHLQCVK